MKRELNACRRGNLRKALPDICRCLRMYAYYQEALHRLRKELSVAWISREGGLVAILQKGGAENSNAAPTSEQ